MNHTMPKFELLLSPRRLFLRVLAVVFLAGLLLHFVILRLGAFIPGGFRQELLDSTALSLMLAPFLWWWIVRPLGSVAMRERMLAVNVINRADQVQSEGDRRYRSLFENMLEGYAFCRMLFTDGRPNDFIYLEVNNKFKSITGLTNVVGKKVSEVIPGIRETNPEIIQTYARVAASGKPERFETFVPRLGIWFDIAVYSPAKDHFVAVFDDITERRRAAEQMRLQSAALESAGNAVVITDEKGEIIWVNPAFTQTTGYSSAEAVGRNPRLLRSGKQDRAFYQEMWETILDGRIWRGTLVNRRKDGGLNHEDLTITPIRNSAGEITHFVGIKQDITEKTRAQEALLASELRYRRLFESAKDGILILDAMSGQIIDVNPFLIEMLGYSKAELVGRELWEIGVFKDVLGSKAAFAELQEEGYIRYEDLPLRTREGLVKQVEFVSNSYLAGDSRVIQCNIRDITERKQAEDDLRESEERYRDLVENAHDIIYTHDLSGRYTSMNAAGTQITGYTLEEALALDLTRTVAPEHIEKVREMLRKELAGERVPAHEIQIIARDGHRITVEVNNKLMFQHGVPVGVQGIARNVTERKLLEDQLRQSQKMEAIGQLAGGVAHDFNNLLTAINGYSGLALQRIGDDHPLRSYLEEIKKAGDRAANLTRQLLAFGRKQILQPLPINLNDVITDMNKMLRRLIGEDIVLTAKLDPALKKIKADPGQVEQVLVNLIVNARDAMAQGGNLTIETTSVDLDEHYADRHVGVVPGSYVMLAVSDTGTGMDEETRARIFDPFFTTKEKGKGTGLGLSTVYGIVKQSGGNIWVYSELGHGTTFKVYLPVLAAGPQKDEAGATESAVPGGSETVLLVEDEDVVRGLARKILEHAGYHVLEASCGQEAIRLGREHSGPIDLLLTDVVMPETSGKEVADRLTEVLPGLRVLYMSGYTDEAIVHHGVLDADVEFIQKPFTPAALVRKVRAVLDFELVPGELGLRSLQSERVDSKEESV